MSKSVTKTELAEEAKSLLESLTPSGVSATTIFLNGNLGAGKTTFTQLLAVELGVTETVVSPTYVILKKYSLPQGGKWQTLIHVDLYRLDNLRDIEILGLHRLATEPSNLLMIEWPKQIPNSNINPTVTINLETVDEDHRLIEIIYGQ